MSIVNQFKTTNVHKIHILQTLVEVNLIYIITSIFCTALELSLKIEDKI